MNFTELHNQNTPLLISNVWDVPSAKIAEKLNFQAIGTSSLAIASLLGYEDGEEISFSELKYFVEKIISNTKLPLTVDLEAGYGDDEKQIIENIKELAKLGVVGVNIEDSLVKNGERTLVDAENFSKLLENIVATLTSENIDIFINIRTDTFLLGVENTISETQKRISLYENAGVDGIFVPCIETKEDIEVIVKSTKLPLNVMCMPNIPDFKTLNNLGVRRISMGNFVFDKMYNQFENITQNIVKQQSFQSIF